MIRASIEIRRSPAEVFTYVEQLAWRMAGKRHQRAQETHRTNDGRHT